MSQIRSVNRPIRFLAEDLASQIAAGEVVERPASVVKELIENSLDADATRVDVSIQGGGITLIEVSDDGCGMSARDAPLSLGRHATSKLARFEELEEIVSYGFRGEALPSVASVSRLSLRTRTEEEEGGVLLVAEGTTEPRTSLVGSPVGTTLSVRDLFYNVPARRKFLRSSNTEAGHVTDVVVDAALSRPDVTFTLTRDERRTKTFPRVPSRLERVGQVLTDEQLTRCGGQKGPLEVEAFLTGPERGRKGTGGLKLLVNGRPVRDRALAATIAHAYGEALERGRYPRGVVYLTLPGRLVDVNVHPQKTEVRFADPRAVTDAVYGIVKRQLLSVSVLDRAPVVAARSESRSAEPSASPRPRVPDSRPRLLREGSKAVGGQRYAPAIDALAPSPRVSSGAKGTFKNLRLLGQLRGSYLICEGEDGLYVLDQHAAHERVLLTELKRAYDASRVTSQALLFPAVFHLSPRDHGAVSRHAAVFARFGLDVRPRGEDAVSVHSVPQILGRSGPEDLLRDICAALADSADDQFDEDSILARIACSEAVKPGDRLQKETGDALLRSLALANFDLRCPHGKVIVSVTLTSDLENKAGRKK